MSAKAYHSAEAGAPAQVEVVTPEMRQAGAAVLSELSGVISSEGLAERVYIAMAGVAPPCIPNHQGSCE